MRLQSAILSVATITILSAPITRAEDFKRLAIGSPCPEFSLPGVDDKTHTLNEYKDAQILMVIFTCNHCPTAQAYEDRILNAEY